MYFAGRKFDVPFRKLFLLFGAFIVLCGFTHFVEAYTTWVPIYRFAGVLKIVTGVVSWATVLSLIPVVPQALAMRSPQELEREIRERERAEAAFERQTTELRVALEKLQQADDRLRQQNEQLEQRVRERTEELEKQASELKTVNDALRRSNEELDDFVHVASHDLKEPLRGIHNYATILQEDCGPTLDQDARDKLTTMSRLSLRLEELTNSLLEISRVGRGNLARQETDIGPVLSKVLESLSITLRERAVRLRIQDGLPRIRADRVRLGEVFYNLISNAIKYNESQPPEVWVGFRSEPGETVFWVRDNGIGIPPKHHATIFRIFKRLHPRDRFGGGIGAGLSIVKKIVERHNGRVWLESAPGSGTTFYFAIPSEVS